MNDIRKSRFSIPDLFVETIRPFLERFKPILGVYLFVFLPQSLLFTYMDIKTGHFHDVSLSSAAYVFAIMALRIPVDVLILNPLVYQYAIGEKTDFYRIINGLYRKYFRSVGAFLAVLLICLGLCFPHRSGIVAAGDRRSRQPGRSGPGTASGRLSGIRIGWSRGTGGISSRSCC